MGKKTFFQKGFSPQNGFATAPGITNNTARQAHAALCRKAGFVKAVNARTDSGHEASSPLFQYLFFIDGAGDGFIDHGTHT